MINIICPSPKGKEIALKLQKSIKGILYIKEDNTFNLLEVTKKSMESSHGIIFISSIGIAVRAISKFLKSKAEDPGVVVVDLNCKFSINILSGHIGGGNDLTLKVAEILNIKPIITTATDNLNIMAPDIIAKNNNLLIDNLKIAKNISALLVNENIVGIKDDFNKIEITKGYKKIDILENNSIWITNKTFNERYNKINKNTVLKLIKINVILGIGCRRNTPYEKLYDFVNDSLKKYGYDIRSVYKIVSVEVKKDEKGIIDLAEKLKCPFETFRKEEIRTVQDKYEKSEFVLRTLGITGVCEPCVDLAGGKVEINKIKYEGMTLAIGILKA